MLGPGVGDGDLAARHARRRPGRSRPPPGRRRPCAGWAGARPRPRSRCARSRRRARPPPCRTAWTARSATSGSFAAFSITVVPLASTAAMSRLSVAVWLGYSRTTRVPTRRPPGTVPRTSPWDDSKRAPMALRPVEVEVDRPVAEVVPARQRHPHGAAAGQEEPEDDDRGPHPLEQLVGARGHQLALRRGGHAHIPVVEALHPRPDGAQHLGHGVDVGDARDVGEHRAALGQQAGRHQLERRILRTACTDGAPERAVGLDHDLIHDPKYRRWRAARPASGDPRPTMVRARGDVAPSPRPEPRHGPRAGRPRRRPWRPAGGWAGETSSVPTVPPSRPCGPSSPACRWTGSSSSARARRTTHRCSSTGRRSATARPR